MILNDLAKCLQLLALNLNYSEKIRLIFFWQGLIHSNLSLCFSKPIVGFIFSPNFIWEGKIFRELLKKDFSLLLNHHFISGCEFDFVMEGLEGCFDLTGSPFVLASFESHVWNFSIPWKLSISFCPRLAESPSSTLNQVPGYSLERLLPSYPRRLNGLFQLQWPKP